ncbi:MAG: hypothetical protein Q8P67_27130 [archaeon]|nr:hypothetical protein [archaeon]
MAGSGWEVGEKTTPRLANKEGCLEALVILSPFGRSASDELQRKGKALRGFVQRTRTKRKKTHTKKTWGNYLFFFFFFFFFSFFLNKNRRSKKKQREKKRKREKETEKENAFNLEREKVEREKILRSNFSRQTDHHLRSDERREDKFWQSSPVTSISFNNFCSPPPR